jgi:hypothetical protein
LRASGRFITIRAMRDSGRSTTMVSNSMKPSRFPGCYSVMLLFRQMIGKRYPRKIAAGSPLSPAYLLQPI